MGQSKVKSHILSKAHVFSEVGMLETAQPLWMSAAAYEESIAPLLDSLGRELEAAVHRVSAASCYQKAGDLIRAVNLYHAALAGPLRDDTRQEVDKMLADCLSQLTHQSTRLIPPPMCRRRQSSCKDSVIPLLCVGTVSVLLSF